MNQPTTPAKFIFATWLLVFFAAILMQWSLGTWQSDLGGDPDEAAHAVTSLMIRDYIAQAAGSHPMAFAKDYYERYPKVALGHYPPAYYLLAGCALLPAPKVVVLFILQSALAATVVAFMVSFGRAHVSIMAATIAALAWWLSAPVQKLLMLVMSDFLQALTCLGAMYAFYRFMLKPRATWSLLFGLLSAAAILTKGAGWLLALLPPFAILVSREWKLLLKPALWLAPLPVLILALPWQWYSLGITEEGMSGLTIKEHFLVAIPFYLQSFISNYGYPLALLCALTTVKFVWDWIRGLTIITERTILWSLVLACLVMLLTIPTGVSPRYFIIFSAPLLLLALSQLEAWIKNFGLATSWRALICSLVVIVSVGSGLLSRDLQKNVKGFSDAMLKIKIHQDNDVGTVLVCSDPRGEGALVAATAFDEDYRGMENFKIIRASKELAQIDWMGRGDEKIFSDTRHLLKHLRSKQASWIIVDDSVPEDRRQAYYSQLMDAMRDTDGEWQMMPDISVKRDATHHGALKLYKRVNDSNKG